MFTRFLRWMSGLDRSYFFAFSAFVAAIISSIALVFAPIVERFDGSEVTLIEDSGGIVIVLLILPILVLGSPLIALPQKPGPRRRNDKINSIAATFVLLAFVFIAFVDFGLFYMPALILSVASSVSLFFGSSRKAAATSEADSSVGPDGVRLSRSARRRLRQQEQHGGNDGQQGETPLSSSRRRRGRRRRKR